MSTGRERCGNDRRRRDYAIWRGLLALGWMWLTAAVMMLGLTASPYALPVVILAIGFLVALYAHGSPGPRR